MAYHLDESIPKACGDWASIKGAYRWISHPEVTHEKILQAHREATLGRMGQSQAMVILIHDTVYMQPSAELEGAVATNAYAESMAVHQVLAVTESGTVLGLLSQTVEKKLEVPEQETKQESRRRQRKSQRWGRTLEKVRQGPGVIHVMDREADIYELLQEAVKEGDRFIIRSSWDRKVRGGSREAAKHIADALCESPVMGRLELEVPARPGQSPRKALLAIRRTKVTLRPPKALSGYGGIPLHVVEARELHPPQGVTSLHWRLLTAESVDNLKNCLQVIKIYSRRWVIEEFHKALKTGCHIEERQLQTRKRWKVVLALSSVLGVMLLSMRDQAHRGDGPATVFFSPIQLVLLRRKYRWLGVQPGIRQALRAVAMMGGFIGRKSDGDPGWITLYRGLKDLLHMESNYHDVKSIVLSRRPSPIYG